MPRRLSVPLKTFCDNKARSPQPCSEFYLNVGIGRWLSDTERTSRDGRIVFYSIITWIDITLNQIGCFLLQLSGQSASPSLNTCSPQCHWTE